ncbi:predicted transcriptional regulator, partial [Paenibacillus popilliae ATCC 14706]
MGMTVIKTMGELIQDTRRALDITLTQLSVMSGIPKGTISKIEKGDVKRPEFETIRPLAMVLKIPLETLINYYVEIEKRSESLMCILQTTIQQCQNAELIRKVATKFLESPNEDSLDLTEKLYRTIKSVENNSIQLLLYDLIIDYSRSHGIMPYIAKGMYQKYLIERDDFSRLKETYYSGKYVLHYVDFLSQHDRIELYYKLGVHALRLRLYEESIDHSKRLLVEDSGTSPHKVNALCLLMEAYFCIEKYEEAEIYCLQYKQFNYPQIQENVALVEALLKAKRGHVDQAINQLQKLLKTCSDLSALPVTKHLLKLNLQQNNLAEANAIIESSRINVSFIDERNPLNYFNYADYLRVQGEYYLVLGDIEQCIAHMVESASWYSKVNDTFHERSSHLIMRMVMEK